jgi:hypothetical protein
MLDPEFDLLAIERGTITAPRVAARRSLLPTRSLDTTDRSRSSS